MARSLTAEGRGFVLLLGLFFVLPAPRPVAGAGESPVMESASLADSPDPSAAAAIRFYQRYVSSLRHGHCCFRPSCSQYALDAVRDFGLLAGAARAADRLVRCNRSAARWHAVAPDGRLEDPAGREPRGPRAPQVPLWLLPDHHAPAKVRPAGTGGAGDPAEAVRAAEYLAFAAALAREGDCDRAATEYQRAAHLAGAPGFHAWARARSGECRYLNSEWVSAEREFLAAGMLAPTEEERRRASVMAGACRFNMGDFASCDSILAACTAPDEGLVAGGVPVDTAEDYIPGAGAAPQRIGPATTLGLRGLCALADGDWSGARERFRRGIVADPAGPSARKLAELWTVTGRGPFLARKREWIATTLSAVVPGAGQIYAGRASDGLRHFFFNVALLYSVVKLARDRHYPAAAVVAGIEIPFFAGNLIGARNSAASFNRAKRMDLVMLAIRRTEP